MCMCVSIYNGLLHYKITSISLLVIIFQNSLRDDFHDYLSFFPEATFRLIFQKALFVPQHANYFSRRTICLFIEKMPVFKSCLFFARRHNIFPRSYTLLWNMYKFPRSLYFLIEQKTIFQEALSSHHRFFMSSNRLEFSRKVPPVGQTRQRHCWLFSYSAGLASETSKWLGLRYEKLFLKF